MQTPAAKARHPRLQQRLLQAVDLDGSTLNLERLLELIEADYATADAARQLEAHLTQRVVHEGASLDGLKEATFRARTAQARMEAVLEHASEAVISCSADRSILAYNKAAARLYGWSADEVLGKHVGMLFEGEWNAAREQRSRELVEAPGDAHSVAIWEMRAARKDGALFDVEISVSRVEVDGVVTLTGFHRDVSARKREEAALVEARNVAEAANRAKTDFLAAMSHEIRTPLNGVLGMAAALETTPLSDLQRRMLGVINESGQSLMALLSDILDLSKIESGHMEFETTPLDLAASLEAVAGLYEETARAKGLEFDLQVTEGARGTYLGDPTRIRQVLQNLLSNAMKFTAAGSVQVRVDAAALADGRRHVTFEIEDTGVGISDEAQARLFSKFMQAETSTTRKFGGTGLGLAICRELVTAMGGAIGVESEEGRGSRFWFTLPLALAVEAEPEPAAEAVEEVEESRPLRILAAEDNPTNQFVLRAILGQGGLEASFVENGREAVAAVQANDYDLVLMDLHMPEMDGLTATQHIRALGGAKARIPIVAVTAEAMPEQVRRCLAAGMDAHVAKPIRPDVLYAVIEEVLTRESPERKTA